MEACAHCGRTCDFVEIEELLNSEQRLRTQLAEARARIEKLETGEQCKDCQRFDEQHAKQHRINTQQAKRIEKLERVRYVASTHFDCYAKTPQQARENVHRFEVALRDALAACEEKEPTT